MRLFYKIREESGRRRVLELGGEGWSAAENTPLRTQNKLGGGWRGVRIVWKNTCDVA
jgi:hypothetical protein